MQLKDLFKKKNLHITLAREEIYLFFSYKHSTLDLHIGEKQHLVSLHRKNIFLFLICHCTKRATDKKMNPHVKNISEREKKGCIIHFTLTKRKVDGGE